MTWLAVHAILLPLLQARDPGADRVPGRLLIEDFDRPRLHDSRLDAEWGPLNHEGMRLEFSPEPRCGAVGYSLKVRYRAEPGRPGGLWFSGAGPADDGRLTRDLSPYDELLFCSRGSGPDSPSYRLRIDLTGGGPGEPPFVASWTEATGGGVEWKAHRIPLDPRRWSGTSVPSRFSRVKMLRFRIEAPENPPEGEFYLDCIECARQGRTAFDWKRAPDDDLLNYIELHTYRYFEQFADPLTGFAYDRSSQADVSSIAASGFALAGHAIAASRGWISREEGGERVRRLLRTLNSAEGRATHNGLFYHFVDSATSAPKAGSEVSIIDTALLICGASVARKYFGSDPEIERLADRLIREANWAWFFDAARGFFYMAWSPSRRSGYEYPDPSGSGYFCGSERNPVHWGVYTDEVGLISILAAASPSHPVPISAFHSVDRTCRDYKGIRMSNSYNGSLFTYLFGSCFLDTRSFGATSGDFDWYLNSTRAIAANHQFAVEQSLPPWAFGISACEGPDGNYHNYGAPPSTVTPEFDGTLAIYGIVGSIIHRREDAMKAIRELFALDLFREGAGFADAFNPLRVDPKSRLPWVNWTGFGIDQGAILLLIENARTGFAWKQFEADVGINRTLGALFPRREQR